MTLSIGLLDLWLPILLGGVFCWIASMLAHMLIKHHNADYKQLSNEDQVADAIRAVNPRPALYQMPHCTDMKEMGDESTVQKFNNGPVAIITIFNNGMPPMGKLLVQQLLFFLVACLLVAYVATLSLDFSAEAKEVFRVVMPVGFLAFGYAGIPYSIWYGHPWSNCLRFLIDSVVYAAITAATFAWLWPTILT